MTIQIKFRYFLLFFIPMCIISLLINMVYSLQVDQYMTLNWISVIGLAVILSLLMVWRQTWKKKDS